MTTVRFSIQLEDMVQGGPILASGGLVYVAATGDTTKLTLTDDAGAALSNPVALTRGKIEFNVPVDTAAVDLYGIAPGGHAFQALGLTPSGPNEIFIDTGRKHQVLVIPFDQADFTANTETDTGFNEPANAVLLPSPFIRVTAVDSGETLAVGTATADSGDPDGLLDDVLLTNLGVVKATIVNAGNTLGALFEVQDSANSGDLTHEGHVSGGKSIVILTSAGSDTGKGFINLPFVLSA